MTQTDVPQTTLQRGDDSRVDEPGRPREEAPDRRVAAAPQPKAAARPSGWTAGRITTVVIGALLVLLSLVLLGSGGSALWADRTQRDGGYATTDVHTFSTSGSALATVSTELGSAGLGWLYAPSLLGYVRIRVTPNTTGALFIGIGHSTDVDRYLAGVDHTVINEFWGDETENVAGGPVASAPGTQDFWVASATGSGPQTLTWDPADGSWTVVVMNADGHPGIAMGADLGAKVPALPWIGLGLLVGGLIFMAGGVFLVVGTFRSNRTNAVEG